MALESVVSMGVGIVVQQVESLLGMPASHVRVPGLSPDSSLLQCPANVLGQWVTAHVVRFLLPTWEIQIESLVPAFSLVQLLLVFR